MERGRRAGRSAAASHSPTGAHADIFAHREPVLAELRAAFPARPGQCGIALVLPDGHVCLDYLSRPDAYADHHRKLLDGYLLDALDQLDRAAAGHRARLNRLLHRLSLVPLGAAAPRPASASTCAPRRRA